MTEAVPIQRAAVAQVGAGERFASSAEDSGGSPYIPTFWPASKPQRQSAIVARKIHTGDERYRGC